MAEVRACIIGPMVQYGHLQLHLHLPVLFQVPDEDGVSLLQKFNSSSVAGVGLGGGVGCVGHGGAEEEGGVIHKDLESIHIVVIKIVDLEKKRENGFLQVP